MKEGGREGVLKVADGQTSTIRSCIPVAIFGRIPLVDLGVLLDNWNEPMHVLHWDLRAIHSSPPHHKTCSMHLVWMIKKNITVEILGHFTVYRLASELLVSEQRQEPFAVFWITHIKLSFRPCSDTHVCKKIGVGSDRFETWGQK